MERGYREERDASSAAIRPRNLPPLTPKKAASRSPCKKNNSRPGEKDWATSWAQRRAGNLNAQCSSGMDPTSRSNTACSDKKILHAPVTIRKREVIVLNEKDAASLKRVKGIYANTKDKALRSEIIKTKIRTVHQKALRSEMDHNMKEYKKKLEQNKTNREELKRVRKRFVNDKKRRDSKSYISLSAYETPQVSRKSFGLPEEGEELNSLSTIEEKAEKKYKELWRRTMKRSSVIDAFLNHKSQEVKQIPIIKVRERAPSIVDIVEKEKQEESVTPANSLVQDKLIVDMMMSEIDTLSQVDLDLDGDEDDQLSELTDGEDT